jgi:hypothetical protein
MPQSLPCFGLFDLVNGKRDFTQSIEIIGINGVVGKKYMLQIH